jgi:iron(III) transport system permease protein
VLLSIPVLFSITQLFNEAPKWSFIVSNILTTYLINTLILVFMVGVFSVSIGFFAAYVISTKSFKGRNLLSLFLYLPLAMPAYVLSYIYVDTFSFSGRMYRLLSIFGITFNYPLFSMSTAIFVLTLSLFPYAYIPLKAYLTKRNQHHEDVARMLRIPLWKRIVSIHLPLILPTLMTSLMFIIFETVNDYGVTKYLNIKTLSVGIFDAWFQLNDLTSALYLAITYIVVLLSFYFVYQLFIKDTKKDQIKTYEKPHLNSLNKRQTLLYTMPLWILVFFSLGLPIIELLFNIIESFDMNSIIPWLNALISTLIISLTASFIIIILSLLISNTKRFTTSHWIKKILNLPIFGYAFPGVMIALMYYMFFIHFDRFLKPIYSLFGSQRLVFSLSIWMLMSALVFRFFAIGFKQISNSYESIGMHHTLSAYTLRKGKWMTLLKIDIPMIKKGLIAGFILSFIDIIKELPMTLLLRPFNVQTLSTLIYTYISNEDISKASFASLTLIMISVIFILVFKSLGRKKDVS